MSRKRKPKKQNSSVVVRQSDLKRIQRQVVGEATGLAMAVFFSVLRDKEGYGPKRLSRVMANIEKLMEEVNEGRVSVYDLKKALEQEIGVFLV